MLISDCLPLDEVFTHIDDNDGTVRHFNPSAMYRAVPDLLLPGRIQLITASIDPEFVAFILARRGVEDGKLARMKEPYLSLPLIGAMMDDDTVLTVDGHHRMVVLSRLQRPTYNVYLFPRTEWEKFLITDMPSFMSEMLVEDTRSCEVV